MSLHLLHDVPVGDEAPHVVNAVVEIPRDSRTKYELDKETGLLRFDRLLYSAVHYPGDYGFIPRTLAGDGDPLDVLVIVTEPTFPGCLIEVRPVGVFVMEDDKGIDEKILCVPQQDPRAHEYRVLHDVSPHYLREVEHFFSIYKDLEGKTVRVDGWHDLDDAHRVIREAVERYPGRDYPEEEDDDEQGRDGGDAEAGGGGSVDGLTAM